MLVELGWSGDAAKDSTQHFTQSIITPSTVGPVSNFDIQEARKQTRLDNIPGFIINECSVTLMPVFKYIFTLTVPQQSFQTQWKKY
jgi:hypothetical protein